MSELVVTPALVQLARQAADWLERELASAIAERGKCAVGLTGGRTPEPLYQELAARAGIDWRRVEVFFSDERAVPPDHPDSNFGMVYSALLSRVPIPAGQVHRMEAERPDRDTAAREYERALPQRLDVLLLGMGTDGHTASLFPGSAALDERDRLVVPVTGPTPPAERLTITPPVIEAALRIAVMAVGENKAAKVALALQAPVEPKAVPARLARRGRWFLDRAAASQLADQRVPT